MATIDTSEFDVLHQQFLHEAQVLGLTDRETKRHVVDRMKEERELKAKMKIEEEQNMRMFELTRRIAEEKADLDRKMAQARLERGDANDDLELDENGILIEKDEPQNRNTHRPRMVLQAPKPLPFDEKNESIDAYLFRFERYCSAAGWPQDQWITALLPGLKGKALTAYYELARDVEVSYEEIKIHLMKRYLCTEDGYRNKFRAAKPESGETMDAFFSRSKLLFQRWLEMADVDKSSADQVIDLILREQFVASCSPSLVVFLKERELRSVQEFVTVAERYRLAHPTQTMSAKTSDALFANVAFTDNRQNTGGKGGQGKPSDTKFNQEQQKQTTGQNQFGSRGAVRGAHTGGFERKVCFYCKEPGHLRRKFPKILSASVSVPAKGCCKVCSEDYTVSKKCGHDFDPSETAAGETDKSSLLLCEGTLNGNPVEVMLDTGCTTCGVRKSLVLQSQMTGEICHCRQFNGEIVELPVALVDLDTPYFVGKVSACVIENPISDVILGRIPGAKLDQADIAAAVQTRAQKIKDQRPFRPLLTARAPKLDIGPTEIAKLQEADATLSLSFERAANGTSVNGQTFVMKDGLLYRSNSQASTTQLVVPKPLRESVLIAVHDGIFGGHMGSHSTFKRLHPYFYWPGYWRETHQYCQTCDKCQRTVPRGKIPRVPLQPLPVIETPFQRVGIDLVGPIQPVSDTGYRYILTLVDYASRYPEAVPLKRIDTESVAEALMGIFSRLGIPGEILSDQGSQFTSELFQAVMKLLSVHQIHSTPYHAQTNGLVERFNGTLKTMLKRLMTDKPKDWDRYLPAALFAYREIPQTATGYSPFELMFGRTPRGPSCVLFETWTGSDGSSEPKIVHQFVTDLKETLSEMMTLAQENLIDSAGKAKGRYDKRSKPRSLVVGDEVLVLLPSDNSKLLLKWKGPFKVVQKKGVCDYVIELARGQEKMFHINMLKKYERRAQGDKQNSTAVSVIMGSVLEPDEDVQNIDVRVVPTMQTETVEDVHYNPDLEPERLEQVKSVINKHAKIMTDLPGTVHTIQHSVRNGDIVVNQRQYPMPFDTEKVIEDEVKKMLDLGIIEPSQSPYSSPIVLVKKPDGSVRFCIDFRGLNKVTIFDSEPIPDPESLFVSLRDKNFFTKIDLAKGYWQIPLDPQDKHKTSFRTSQGLFQFLKMPFGLATAPSSFARMMRQLKLAECGSVSFFDDILVSSVGWEEHLKSLDKLLTRLGEFGLTARPTKVEVGFQEIEFLGHMIGMGKMRPVDKKVTKILKLETPRTKRQVRALVGLAGYYRRYIPGFSQLMVPLTELTKKNKPAKVQWTDQCETAFQTVKQRLSEQPAVALPDFDRPFTVRTDASGTGIAGVLMQTDDEGHIHPVMYASRKLLDRETRYSAIERECLALVWAIDKFSRYLTGRYFVVETDHRPLTYLQRSKTTNSRLMRWALALQEYQFSVMPICGTDNLEADILSRLG
ncbi:hypothetical protein V1264_019974 [Littorina saxatilis]|uniref:Gag3-Pol3 n=2 Tax=Littorina saxatilis TaxID=31220 RepID=A0AAN9BAA6_9CAEN